MKIAVVGAGIAGLSCAYRLAQARQDVTLFEAGSYFGGHSNTVDIALDGFKFGVDTGFLVFNERTYPNLVKLFDELGVESAPSEMSFSVKLPRSSGRTLEWAGANLDTVFAQRANLLDPRFLRMVADILRFNRQASAMAKDSAVAHIGAIPAVTLGAWLDQQGYSTQFRHWYLLPMAACIWSCPSDQMLAFPLSTFVRFCHNHGLLQVSDRPQWRTVKGGARNYVDKMLAAIPSRRLSAPVRSVLRGTGAARPVRIESAAGVEHFDHVVMACHSDQALALLGDASGGERGVLSAIRYQPNRAVLHTDSTCLPERRKAWSAWNYQSSAAAKPEVCVHYLLNMLQPLPCTAPVIVSLNPIDAPDPARVLAQFDYAHPVFDAAATAAQERLVQIQGEQNTWFAGAWTGYGFHEDGLKSGLAVAASLTALAMERQHSAA
ncbi:NAD(P)/FAD-dependent oxidoreductase [Massilia psychrophila]|jgi:predicted NAD/FAD-binding protein|uniref:NAD/FAD-binding protein n=1 Tax=Massilia psychrophila TaxID=1603353 RepID=A0A2G8SXS6_9BURK|nr:FAD-dependent oxidoreductase [Massilia psychrophila]PIL38513.1 NAD/FAD-binding protein [Massilia psychrophila]GGE70886.1 amine oxidase [Massilia psychrophila]